MMITLHTNSYYLDEYLHTDMLITLLQISDGILYTNMTNTCHRYEFMAIYTYITIVIIL